MRYVNPKDYGYVSQFIEAPLDYMNRALQDKQKNYDTNEADSNALLEKLKVKARYQDTPFLQEITNKYNERVNNLVKDANGDKGSGKFLSGLTQLRNEIDKDLTTGNLYGIKNNREVYDKWLEERAKQKNYQKHLDENYFSLSDEPFAYRGLKESGISKLGNISEYLDQADKADKIVKDISKEDIAKVGWGIVNKNGHDYIVDREGQEVTSDKIAKTFLPLFERTDEYKQLEKEAIYNNKVYGTDINEYIKNKLNNLLEGVTNKYRSKQTKITAKGDPFDLQSNNKKLNEEELSPLQHYPSELNPTTTTGNVEILPGTKISSLFNVNKDGSLTPNMNQNIFGQNKAATMKWIGAPNVDEKTISQQVEPIKQIVRKFQGTPFWNIMKKQGFTKAVEAYANSVSEATSKDLFTTQYKNVDAQKLTDENLTRLNPETSNFIAADGTAQTLENAANSYGFKISNEDFSTLPKSANAFKEGKASAFLTDINTHSGAFTMNLRDGDGNEVKIPVKSSYEVSSTLAPIKTINENIKQGNFSEYVLEDGKKAKNVFIKTASGKIKVTPRIYNEVDKEWETNIKTSLEQIIKKLPEDIQKDKEKVKANLEYNNPGLEIQINKDGSVNVRSYMSLSKYSDSKTEALINEGYLPKIKNYQPANNVEGLNNEDNE